MAKIILHIGTYKTGSTAIQMFMHQNKLALRQQNVIYPSFPADRHSHTFLRQAAVRGNKAGLEECLAILRKEVAESPDATVVLSSEHFWPTHGDSLQTMLAGLESVCRDIHVVMYVRGQDRLWASLYAQQSKQMVVRPEHKLWGTDSFVGTPISEHGMYYFECLEGYAGRFGRERVTAKLYDRKLFPGGDVVNDFFDFIGASVPAAARESPPDTNLSYDWKAVELSKYCAVQFGEKRYKDHPAPIALRRTITRLAKDDGFSNWLGGHPCYLSIEDQNEIREHYAASNRKLSEAYFAGGDLFAKDGLLAVSPYRLDDIPEKELELAMGYMRHFIRLVDSEGEVAQRRAARGRAARSQEEGALPA